MSRTLRTIFRLPVLLTVAGLLLPSLTNAAADSPAAENHGVAPSQPAPPPLPPLKSPVEAFRTLLRKSAAEQQDMLAIRPPEVRARIVEKLQEYQSLTPEECELRLQATELRWYLVPLLSLPATNRAEQLARIPQPARELVEARLQYWTILPPPLREVLLTNPPAMSYSPPSTAPDAPPSPADAVRRRMLDAFERMLELTQKEKEKTLRNFPETERQQMEKTIAAFEQLTPSQRSRCVKSFTRFATMTPEAREDFLKNAERWSQMSVTERETWRELVNRAPLLPPQPTPPVPPQAALTSKPPAAPSGN